MNSRATTPSACFTPINKPYTKHSLGDAGRDADAFIRPRLLKRVRTLPASADFVDAPSALVVAETTARIQGESSEITRSKSRRVRQRGHASEGLQPSTTGHMSVVKAQNKSDWGRSKPAKLVSLKSKPLDRELSTSSVRRFTALDHDNHGHPERHLSLVAPDTSLDSLRSSPDIGCSVYDTRRKGPKSQSSPSRGHRVNRIASRTLFQEEKPESPHHQMEVPKNRVALVTDLEGINEALDARYALKLSSVKIATEFIDNATSDTSDLNNEEGQGQYCAIDAEQTSNPVSSEISIVEQHKHTVEPVNGLNDDDMYDDYVFDTLLDSDDFAFDTPLINDDNLLMFDDECFAELESLTRQVEDQVKAANHDIGTTSQATTPDSGTVQLAENNIRGLETMADQMSGTSYPEVAFDEELTRTPETSTTPTVCENPWGATGGTTSIRQTSARKPIVRKPFPDQVQDRSPVTGLTSDTVLRTCFRVGEALNAGCQAVRLGRHVILELYARVISSTCMERSGSQRFVFADLYHDDPPHIDGVHEGWKNVLEREQEMASFLGASDDVRMCRVVGSMRRKNGSKWEMVVQAIRGTTWDEVEYIAGIHS